MTDPYRAPDPLRAPAKPPRARAEAEVVPVPRRVVETQQAAPPLAPPARKPPLPPPTRATPSPEDLPTREPPTRATASPLPSQEDLSSRGPPPPLPARGPPPPLPTREPSHRDPGKRLLRRDSVSGRSIREGAMKKQERGKWQSYWFVLTDQKVVYFSGEALCGQIGAESLVVADSPFGGGFALLSPKESFVVDGDYGWRRDFAAVAAGKKEELQLAPIFCPKASRCQKCGTAFSIMRRRQHCWQCGSMVCHACSTEQIPIDREGGQLRRVCDPCYSSYVESRCYGRR